MIGTGVLCISCDSLSISQTLFRNLSADTGAAIYLLDGSNSVNSKWKIEDCRFEGNSIATLGAVFAQNTFLTISRSVFTENRALESSARGAAVALISSSDLSSPCYEVLESNFEDNQSPFEGGAIYWQGTQPAIANNTFVRNTAKYGANIASRAVSLAFSNGSLEFLADVPSGQHSKATLVFELRDHIGQVVTTDDSSFAQMTSLNPSTSLSGEFRVQAQSGRYNFTDFVIISPPGWNTSLEITSTVLSSDQLVRVNATMRECLLGETRSNNQCIVCSSGTFSLDPELSCQNCPSEAICYGNFTMVPRPGYWRYSQLTDKFFECPNKDACLGGTALNLTGECAEGYEGNKCQSCAKTYNRMGKTFCTKCSSKGVQAIGKILMLAGMVVVLVLLTKSALKLTTNFNLQSSVHLKILVNYFQLVMLFSAFNLSWPDLMLQLFSVQETVGAFPEIALSPSCFLDTESEEDSYYLSLLLMAFVEPGLILASCLVWALIAWRQRSTFVLRNQMVASGIVLFFLAYPSVVRVMLGVFQCEEIGPGEYWVVGLQVRCWTDEHLKYALGLALPSILVWGVVIPLALLLLVSRQKFRYSAGSSRFNFLVAGYKTEKFYWEFLTVTRKLLIICLTVFFSQISISFQVLSVLAVLSASIVLQRMHQPYAVYALNRLESRSLVIAMTTLYAGLFYYSGTLGYVSQTLLFGLIVVVNAYFTCICLKPVAYVAVIWAWNWFRTLWTRNQKKQVDDIQSSNFAT